jgi:hypothetical protein
MVAGPNASQVRNSPNRVGVGHEVLTEVSPGREAVVVEEFANHRT